MIVSDTRSTPNTFAALRDQLADAAVAFAGMPGAAGDILTGMVDDVDRALSERLEIFPVCHHSPASGLAMVRRLREKQPSVIYLELCEDLRPLLDELRNCRLPVALQAFATDIEGFPAEWAPLSVVAPITESSAEYQAIAYALETPGVELVLVDRSTDHVFQWAPKGRSRKHLPTTSRPRTRAYTALRWASKSVICDRVSPNSKNTYCTTARSGTGRNGGTSTWSSPSWTPITTPTARSW